MASTWIHLEYESVRKVTDKAVLLIIEGEEVWIPFSQIAPDDRDGWEEDIGSGSVCVTDWIAHEKGLA